MEEEIVEVSGQGFSGSGAFSGGIGFAGSTVVYRCAHGDTP
jgi:hypothetical protein